MAALSAGPSQRVFAQDLVLYCGRHDFGTRVLAKTGNLKAVMTDGTRGREDGH